MLHVAFRTDRGSPQGCAGVLDARPAIAQRLLLCALLGGGYWLLTLASFGLAPLVLNSFMEVPPNRYIMPLPGHVLMAYDVTSLFRGLGWFLALVLLVALQVSRLPSARRLRPALFTASLLLFFSSVGLIYYLLTLPLWVENHYGLAVRLALFEAPTLR